MIKLSNIPLGDLSAYTLTNSYLGLTIQLAGIHSNMNIQQGIRNVTAVIGMPSIEKFHWEVASYLITCASHSLRYGGRNINLSGIYLATKNYGAAGTALVSKLEQFGLIDDVVYSQQGKDRLATTANVTDQLICLIPDDTPRR